jgi:hypothetical protein
VRPNKNTTKEVGEDARDLPHPNPVTHSPPLARPLQGLRLRQIPFAASQAAQVPKEREHRR